MDLRGFVQDDNRAVSPVIGVILMVAITVILAAVIASMTLGLGDSAQSAPQAKFDFNQYNDSGVETVDIEHASGATIEADNIEFVYSGGTNKQGPAMAGADSEISAGETVSFANVSKGETIKVVWTSADGGSSTTMMTYEVQ